MTKRNIRQIVTIAVLAILLIVLSLLKNSVAVCEWFATNYSRLWIFIFGNIFGWIPFSVYELFFIVAICYLIFAVVRLVVLLCAKKWKKLLTFFMSVVIVVLSFLNIYTSTASMSYNRSELPLPMYSDSAENYTYTQALELAEKFIDKLNYCAESVERDEDGNVSFPFSYDELNDMFAEEYSRLDEEYFSPYTPKVKKFINKTIMSELHLSGVFFAPTGEPNINPNEYNYTLPFTMAHELAHAKGVMRENEANLVACYLLLTSENIYLQYSALVWGYSSVLGLLSLYPNSSNDVTTLYNSINDAVKTEIDNYYNFLESFHLLDDVGEFFNDIYLKLNDQNGTESYSISYQSTFTGEIDDFGVPVREIISFSDVQMLLIGMDCAGLL